MEEMSETMRVSYLSKEKEQNKPKANKSEGYAKIKSRSYLS